MAAAGPYQVTVTLNEPVHYPNHSRHTPFVTLVDGEDVYMVNPSPGSPTYVHVDPKLRMSVVHVAAHRSIEWPPNKGNVSFIETPLTLMEDLGKFDVAKRIERRGAKKVKGRTVEEVLVREEADKNTILLDLDPERGVPLSMADYAPGAAAPVMQFEYSYDGDGVKQAIAKLTSGGEGAVPMDLAKDWASASAENGCPIL